MSETKSEVEHKCDGVIVQCMDWRIQKTLSELLKSLDLETADCLSIPGGAGKNPELVDQWVELSIKLHQPDTILLTVHEDCGAGATRDDLAEAFKRIKKTYSGDSDTPNKTFRAFWINLDGSWEELE